MGNSIRFRPWSAATISILVALSVAVADGSGELRRIQELKRPGGQLTIAVERTITDADGRSMRAILAEDHRRTKYRGI